MALRCPDVASRKEGQILRAWANRRAVCRPIYDPLCARWRPAPGERGREIPALPGGRAGSPLERPAPPCRPRPGFQPRGRRRDRRGVRSPALSLCPLLRASATRGEGRVRALGSRRQPRRPAPPAQSGSKSAFRRAQRASWLSQVSRTPRPIVDSSRRSEKKIRPPPMRRRRPRQDSRRRCAARGIDLPAAGSGQEKSRNGNGLEGRSLATRKLRLKIRAIWTE